MINNNTVAAISTSVGKAALGIIRITGNNTFELVSKCIEKKEKFLKNENRKISLNTIISQKTGEMIDEVTIIKYCEPHSFTGENMVEIICHGGRTIIEKIYDELRNAGIAGADKGEFSKRAFLNGKINLMKAEAINAMIASNNEISRKIALRSYQGGCLEIIKKIQKEINNILANIESEIEFEEEDDIKEKSDDIELVSNLKNIIENEIKKRRRIKEIEKGKIIVIAGPTNAGKSTLFNKLLGYERAIIFNEPGTTRDVITEKIKINEEEITITDTAGIRKTENDIEKIGIEKSEEEIKKANLILWVTAINEKIRNEEKEVIKNIEKEKILIILNKDDLEEEKGKTKFYQDNGFQIQKVSLKKDNIEGKIIELIGNRISNKITEDEYPEIISNQRHEEIFEIIINEIENAIHEWKRKEIAAFHLHNAMNKIEEIVGKRDREDLYNTIFETFCIGK